MRTIVARELANSAYDEFGAGFLERIETFAIELALWGSKLNLTAAPDDPAEIAFHVIDSLAPLMLARKSTDDSPAAEQTSGRAKIESSSAEYASRKGGPASQEIERTSGPVEHEPRKLTPKSWKAEETLGKTERISAKAGQESKNAEQEPRQAGQESRNVERTLWNAGPESLAGAFTKGVRVLDLGSGAGFPGLILASACEAEFVLVEARRKRASFLTVTATAMGLTNVRVTSSRVEPPRADSTGLWPSGTDSTGLEPVYDVVTARAFAEPAVALRAAAGALKPSGRAILYATPAQRLAIEAAAADRFEPPMFLAYELVRGVATVSHILAIARLRQP